MQDIPASHTLGNQIVISNQVYRSYVLYWYSVHRGCVSIVHNSHLSFIVISIIVIETDLS